MKLNHTIRQCGATLFVAAITLFTLANVTDAGPFSSGRTDGGASLNRHGADDPPGHDAGDDHGRGRGRGRGGDNNPTPTPGATASPSASPDDHGRHHGRH